ncbi:glycine betaine ABC transporter substrate-binding protein [Herbivorax sp. ANBcel31]|uniref:glycine betaine ABC transporter substrate-binding protein n=1 Tax=Herbivorax sp. ANBcel31 TaxID=3069754 RepID=UPI0027B4DDF8|nr:glycine betaine ABC transporter substrate-binding protein [Herbivorax sp. ANBcel31]MDQ2087572.1 glycine betaine ABC transporter substrate-binding protein [Herbivorax sp. ANBcel31]
MKKTKSIVLIGLGLVLILVAGIYLHNHQAAIQEDDKKVTLTYVEWASEIASTNVVRAVLQERMGYDVDIVPVSASAMWQSLTTGDSDGMVGAWLPTTHEEYYNQVGGDVDDLGPNLDGTKIGLVVPEYVEIDSIEELNDDADNFQSRIVGIDPGAGIMSATEDVIEQYELEGFALVEGTGATMTATLADAIRNEEWVAVTGWTPHWKFAEWDLKYLDDPEGIYGGDEQIHTITRRGLREDMREVYDFLEMFYWSPEDMETVMSWNEEEGADPYESAKRWIEENKEKVDEWLE